MSFTVLIPARLKSTRLPDKPLADLHGAPMVVRVAQRAAQSAATRVVVAADDNRIVDACRAHGVDALLTRTDHVSGSDRLAEACEQLQLDGEAIVVNVQGDEPLIATAMIDACAALLKQRGDCVMATVAHAIDDAEEFANPNVVKVVLDAAGRALYFSRSADPALARPQRPAPRCPPSRARCATSACTPTARASCAASRRCRRRRSRRWRRSSNCACCGRASASPCT